VIERSDIMWLGIASGLAGGLVGGILLGVGIALVISRHAVGWLLMLPATPAAAVPGWVMALRLGGQLR
jgi:hypothetical protein